MLFCADCGECFHVYCIKGSGTVNPEMRHGWRCNNCKICEICGSSLTTLLGNEELVCSCNRCDRSFHKSCLNYVDENNLNLFVCGYCFKCTMCEAEGSQTVWSYHKDYCRSCYAKEERFRKCAICQQPWSSTDTEMGFCECCEQWIHQNCLASDIVEWYKSDLTRSPYHCKRCKAKQAGAQPVYPGADSMQAHLIHQIQEQRREFRLKELQNDPAQSNFVSSLKPQWRELVKTVIRANSILFHTLPLQEQLQQINERASECRERLKDNRLAEDISKRSCVFVSSRVDSPVKDSKASTIPVKDLSSLLPKTDEATTSSVLSSNEEISEEVLQQVLSFYKSFILLVEDACNAAAYLFVMHLLQPTLFPSTNPFTPTEYMLFSGNLAYPSFFENYDSVDNDPSGEEEIVVGLHGLPGHEQEEHRCCDLCSIVGDHPIAGRMICTLSGDWVHVNCVYYSSSISTDDKTGAIQKYNIVKNQSRNATCCVCNKNGASLKCAYPGCNQTFHFVCGYTKDCFIRVSREAFCPMHNPTLYRHSKDPHGNKNLFHSNTKQFGVVPLNTQSSQDISTRVSSSKLFTSHLNYRVVFPSVKMYPSSLSFTLDGISTVTVSVWVHSQSSAWAWWARLRICTTAITSSPINIVLFEFTGAQCILER